MGWVDVKSECKDAVIAEELRRDDDGELLGAILRFYDDGPTYAWTASRRLGATSDDAAARAAVEERVGT